MGSGEELVIVVFIVRRGEAGESGFSGVFGGEDKTSDQGSDDGEKGEGDDD